MSQERGSNIARTSGFSPISVSITDTYLGGVNGTRRYDLSMSVTNGDVTTSKVVLKAFNLTTGNLIGQAIFNYGDDVSSAVPVSDNGFVANLQPYIGVGSIVEDGSSLTFAKKIWAQDNSETNRPYDNGADEVRFEMYLTIGGFDSAISDTRTQFSTHEQFAIVGIDSQNLITSDWNSPDLYQIDITTGNSRYLGNKFYKVLDMSVDPTRTVNGKPVIMASITESGVGGYIGEITFDGVDNWDVTPVTPVLVAGGITCIQVDTFSGRDVNGRRVIFGGRTAQLGGGLTNNGIICYAWDGVSAYTENGINNSPWVDNESEWDIKINNNTGDIFHTTRWNSGTQPSRIRRMFYLGGTPENIANWQFGANTLPTTPGFDILTCELMMSSGALVTRESKMEVVGYDGILGALGGDVPMFYIFGGNSGAIANDLAKLVWNPGTDFWDRTVLGPGWGNSSSVRSDGMGLNYFSMKVYTGSNQPNDKLREIDVVTESTNQIFTGVGPYNEYVTF